MTTAQFTTEYRTMLIELGFRPINAMRMAMDAAQEIKDATMASWSDRELLTQVASARRAIGLAAVYRVKAAFDRATARSQRLVAEAKRRGIL